MEQHGQSWAQETPEGPFPAHPTDSPTPPEGKGWRDVEQLWIKGSVAREQRPDLRAAAEETGAECAACLARGAQRADILPSTPRANAESAGPALLPWARAAPLPPLPQSTAPAQMHFVPGRLFWHLPETTAERKSVSTKRIYSGATGTRSNVGEEGTVGNG